MKDIRLGKHVIGKNHKPFLIAEMSGNHNQSIDRALAIVKAAADAGAHAIKLQTYTADTMTIKGAYRIDDKNSLWDGKELHDLYKLAYTPWEWHQQIFKYANELGMVAFSSPFDATSVDFLESLNVPVYKVASFENTDHPLLKKIARTKKPVIMSTGVSTLADMYESVAVLRDNGCEQLILLKCTSTYPSTPENTNLMTIPVFQEVFSDCIIGLSDHTMGVGAAIASVALGARVIEKHFTLRRADGGVDSAFSMEPGEFKLLVIESERAFQSLGKVSLDVLPAEQNSLKFKRSVYVTKPVRAGEKFTEDNLRVIRPGDGLPPKFFEKVLGKTANRDYAAGTPLNWDAL
ncbi:MAG TPA: pseudaminic acid synthase [Cyclobacteriaceae bacterium]|nr:pseudaminic acid synthase [Cyclobacteriaceae bacterium]HMV08970.1 pseudaminic acid synthase [Cyclobacteriaceae bacterium]HMX00275.1 pseudaminic acid synthase [Cyclobacteriaceae bacterium]HMX49726.1 pseudaminic acid synthase [Cyclobacteriaceae bacterium]HMY93095.1 pseudaminic acid synthase [Cyclobacteriaceae bacterium]